MYFVLVRSLYQCGGTPVYIGMAHAAPPINTNFAWIFFTNWLSEGSALRYTCKEQQIFQDQSRFPAIVRR